MSNIESITANSILSYATVRNWSRLNSDKTGRLSSRANKRLSTKRITPTEYFSNCNNITDIQGIATTILEKGYSIADSIFSLAINLLSRENILNHPHVQKVLNEYKLECYTDLKNIKLPCDEPDILGSIYQCLICEGEKNLKGSYYTSSKITKNMTADLDFSKGQTFLDPCCGSGAFLLALNNAMPHQIFGIDNDYIAGFIAKINLLIKYKDIQFIPQIYTCDYLDNSIFNQLECLNKKFDYIVTNPPWGAISNNIDKNSIISSNETFSLFFVKAYNQLNDYGKIRFLFPSAILNVKCHKDVRKFMIASRHLSQIYFYDEGFNGVTTKVVDITLDKGNICDNVKIVKDGNAISMPINTFSQTENMVINALTQTDIEIIQKVKSFSRYNLGQSDWALGVVTGDNKNKLKKEPLAGYEKIYTGKEILPYRLKEATNYILYDRSQFQQVAKDEYYRAEEKLAYKFISNKLVFAYDNSRSLFLNSANILIPKIPNMSVKTVMAFLNSELYQYLYVVLFSEIKVLKGNLIELPFPHISKETNDKLTDLVDCIIGGDEQKIELIQDEIYNIFGISKEQIQHVKEFLYGAFN
ncbi:MAG: N-6 DNA methylase [Candidatus Coproplasma sp.]